jgi:hypothetical protein
MVLRKVAQVMALLICFSYVPVLNLGQYTKWFRLFIVFLSPLGKFLDSTYPFQFIIATIQYYISELLTALLNKP